jgi:RHS repeat-associated protein
VATGPSSAPVLTWVHGNHLGVPQAWTNSAGAVTTAPAALLPGFPGQLRTFADLYYNRYRDYDPSTGRYIQADPIGLAGGENAHLYAEANPLKYVDPMGLQERVIKLPAPWWWWLPVPSYMKPPKPRNDSPEANKAWRDYKARYAQPPPPNVDPCEKLAWEIWKEKRLIDDRRAFDASFLPGTGRHDAAIQQSKNRIKNLEDLMKQLGCKCPPHDGEYN